jgi:peptidoglycan/xylan/chitin deacetylase (PgdA/CDA1 family)
VKHTAVLADRVRAPVPGAVILIYHRVGAQADVELDLPQALFREQMQSLANRPGTTTLDDALMALEGSGGGPDPLVVTFDDGTADFVDEALPVLVETRVPALLYLATGFVESGTELPYGGRPLTWAALREAIATGLVTIGSHTHSHAVLDRLSPQQIDDELRRATDLIGEHLGVEPHHFAYPKGVADSADADRVVRAHFESAATGEIRANPYGATDPYRLGRTPIQRSDGMRWFEAKAAGGMRLEGTLRLGLNRLRYRSKEH